MAESRPKRALPASRESRAKLAFALLVVVVDMFVLGDRRRDDERDHEARQLSLSSGASRSIDERPGIHGVLYLPDGSPASGLTVRLLIARTDSRGRQHEAGAEQAQPRPAATGP